MTQQPGNQAAYLNYQLQQQNFITTNQLCQQFAPFPMQYGLPLPVYAPMSIPHWTNLMPNMANRTATTDTTEKQKQEIEDGIAKLRKLNIIDSNFERNCEKNNLNGSTVLMPAFNRSRRLELLKAKKPVAVYKPLILNRWTKEDYINHRNLRKKHMNGKNPELDNSADKKIKLENRRITVQTVRADILKKDMKPYQMTDRWFVVVDTKVLLDDMWFIEKLVNSDPLCRVKLPYETLHDLSQMTMKFRPAWMRAPARRVVQLLEKKSGTLKMINQQGVIENEDLIDNHLATDAVLNCCMQVMRHYYFMVLITDDAERREKAKTIDLPSYSFAELKGMVTQSYTNLHYGHITITREF